MLILEDISAEVPDTNAYHWNFKEHSDNSNLHSVLMYGYNSSANKGFHARCRDFERKVYFNNWAPCEFSQVQDHHGKSPIEYDNYFNEIYSICPYTVDWLNSKNLGREYKSIFYPFNKIIIPERYEKKFDVIYHGGIHGQEHVDCLNVMTKFNYRYVTMTTHINHITQQALPYATTLNLTFQNKINLVAKTKISICYNLVHISPQHIPAIESIEGWKDNEALSEVGGLVVKPQFKTRMHEAAISRTLNLVQKDPWNVAERYYTPDEDFIYFKDKEDLENKIRDILGDWKSYENVIENAYNKSLNYTTDKFIEHIRNDK